MENIPCLDLKEQNQQVKAEIFELFEKVFEKTAFSGGYFVEEFEKSFATYSETKYALGVSNGTTALHLAMLALNIGLGDEVIIPSFTFVSTALAFVRQGAKIVFADSYYDNPNIDADKIEALITPKTKVIVPVHYAGVACDMDKIMSLANKYNLLVVEDAAQAVDSFYRSSNGEISIAALGSIGHLSAFSFHETKNIISGEGGMLVINDDRFIHRAEIIWEKGTNRAEFFRGEVNKYGWVDIGSSFLPSEVIAAFLWAQIENLVEIQSRRKELWNLYYEGLKPLSDKGLFKIPLLPAFATNNAHMFYLECNSLEDRTQLIAFLKANGILAVFHYLSLHNSSYYTDKHDGRELLNCDKFANCLVRLPLFYELTNSDINIICNTIKNKYEQ